MILFLAIIFLIIDILHPRHMGKLYEKKEFFAKNDFLVFISPFVMFNNPLGLKGSFLFLFNGNLSLTKFPSCRCN